MWYLFHGPNTLARDEEIARMKAKLGEPEMASLNTTVIERSALLRDLIAACDALPFLTDKRLVIAYGWLTGPGASKAKAKPGESVGPLQALLGYLPTMPETTRLVFAEDVTLDDAHPLVKLAADKTGGVVKRYELPADPVRWIIERARAKGGDISTQAAQLLSLKINRGNANDRDHFESDSRAYLLKLDNELNKLVSYALGRRIESRDVELLVQDEDVADIFKFVDAMGARDAEAAYRAMRGLLARGESPLVVLAHIARQTRLLIQAKENADLSPEQLARVVGVHPFVAKKASQQAGRFSLSELEQAHAALLEADFAIKTGRMDDVTALDMLVAALCT
ncbi:MAG: DNA polymerase III subunit delta [Chloroflexi bacterium]|jgi:DNA polymerase-3 subunit delta|uniref:DNA polymerase III subunit delta n=1 Tax=Candidatus Thermofonsia Clade 3 bacterium TaxID=2364212 RepID=A0A2M8QF43_9CHLR|nr:DNA polymerase III subunit delta [Candidatus Roseilinea sp. NK_OTU-006]PJF48414.1 MAG: DNA polymerase III subunit delta [Candidatus Thermofonsia Clade 3 bacterium]RMG65221.1 MAG: DNA polymerase III subunit delta [Chloroflexota bacterium]